MHDDQLWFFTPVTHHTVLAEGVPHNMLHCKQQYLALKTEMLEAKRVQLLEEYNKQYKDTAESKKQAISMSEIDIGQNAEKAVEKIINRQKNELEHFKKQQKSIIHYQTKYREKEQRQIRKRQEMEQKKKEQSLKQKAAEQLRQEIKEEAEMQKQEQQKRMMRKYEEQQERVQEYRNKMNKKKKDQMQQREVQRRNKKLELSQKLAELEQKNAIINAQKEENQYLRMQMMWRKKKQSIQQIRSKQALKRTTIAIRQDTRDKQMALSFQQYRLKKEEKERLNLQRRSKMNAERQRVYKNRRLQAMQKMEAVRRVNEEREEQNLAKKARLAEREKEREQAKMMTDYLIKHDLKKHNQEQQEHCYEILNRHQQLLENQHRAKQESFISKCQEIEEAEQRRKHKLQEQRRQKIKDQLRREFAIKQSQFIDAIRKLKMESLMREIEIKDEKIQQKHEQKERTQQMLRQTTLRLEKEKENFKKDFEEEKEHLIEEINKEREEEVLRKSKRSVESKRPHFCPKKSSHDIQDKYEKLAPNEKAKIQQKIHHYRISHSREHHKLTDSQHQDRPKPRTVNSVRRLITADHQQDSSLGIVSKPRIVPFSNNQREMVKVKSYGDCVFHERMYKSLLNEKTDSFKEEFKRQFKELFGQKSAKQISESDLAQLQNQVAEIGFNLGQTSIWSQQQQ